MIKPEEAFLVLEKFHSEQSVVACVGEFFGWSLAFKGRVSELTPTGFSIANLEGSVILGFRLDQEDLAFEYSEPKSLGSKIVVPELSKNAATLGICFPLRLTVADFADPGFVPRREKLFLLELPEETTI